ncbi:MAG: 4Fe-4S dicluster domain-containing protein [Anaerolineales bacterium]
MNTVINIDTDVLAALRIFLRSLLESDVIGSILVPLETKFGTVIPTLVTDPDQLEFANPLAPVMPLNSARAVSAITHGMISTQDGNHLTRNNHRIGVVLRPCEIRALIELIKLKQASREEILLISFDCPGTYEISTYLELQEDGGFTLDADLMAAGQLPQAEHDLRLRTACRICTQPVPNQADIHLHLFGVDIAQGIPVTINDEIAHEFTFLQLSEPVEANWKTTGEKIIEARNQFRIEEFERIRSLFASDGGMERLFAACIRCHNCMTVCPICYCKTCLFRKKEFDHSPEHYLNISRQKGATRLLGDTLLFHLTRMSHMSASCVSCGMCTSACPADIPVGTIFSAVGEQVQAAFNYLPGRDIDEPLPLVTFQVEELERVGETG